MMLRLNYDILTVIKNEYGYTVKNILNGKIIETSEDVIKILSYMKNSFTIEDCAEKFNLDIETIDFIVREIRSFGGMIGDDLNSISSNLTYTSNKFFDSNDKVDLNTICLLGVPYDGASTGATGAKMGPSIIRNYTSKYSDVYTRVDGKSYISYPNIDIFTSYKAFDIGDIRIIPGESSYDVHNRIECVYKEQRNKYPNKIITIGGDHSITFPILNSFSEDFVLVKLDAHYDDNLLINNVVNHANFVRRAINIEKLTDIIHIGIRESRKPGLKEPGLIISTDEYIKEGLEKIKNVFLNKDTNFYISVDVDVLDPSIAPGTGFTLPFGLKLNDIFDIISMFKESGNIIGADIVEYNPLLDKNNLTFYTVLELLKFLIENL